MASWLVNSLYVMTNRVTETGDWQRQGHTKTTGELERNSVSETNKYMRIN